MSILPGDDMPNPWLVLDIRDFSFFCCPECDYRAKSEEVFEDHAIGKHPLSLTFFASEAKAEGEIDIKIEPDVDLSRNESPKLEEHMAEEFNHDIESELDNSDDYTNYREEGEDSTSEKFTCPKCDYAANGLQSLGMHLNKMHGRVNNRWQCPSCESSYPNSSKLIRHLEAVHLKLKIKCNLCEAVMSKGSLNPHMLNAHKGDRINKPFKCDHCDFSSHALKYLKAHIYKSHDVEKHKFQCDKCDKRFPFPHILQEHIEIDHDGLKRYMCHRCGKYFTRKTNLDEHVLKEMCEVISSVKCDECGETFSAKRYLKIHCRAVHGGLPESEITNLEDQVMCDQCSKVYQSKQSLKLHMKAAHSGKHAVPPKKAKVKAARKCPQCEKCFFTPKSLSEHFKSKHEKNTPHKCDHCHRSYGTMSMLRNHTRNMHQRVKCDECSQEICNTFILKRHKATVHKTKPDDVYHCEFCPLFFKREIFLKRHLEKHHPQEYVPS